MNDTKRLDITVSRTIGAAPDEVYDAWLDSSRPGGLWFALRAPSSIRKWTDSSTTPSCTKAGHGRTTDDS